MSKGIWKSVYLATVSSVALTHVVPQVSPPPAFWRLECYPPLNLSRESALSSFPVGSRFSAKLVCHQIKYMGAYPTEPLEDGSHGGFSVTIRVFTW